MTPSLAGQNKSEGFLVGYLLEAAWVPLVNPTVPDFVSARVRNYEVSPEGALVDQFWLR
jgi:hypothetical protein